ncbi:MAG: shikimate dehydrogenase [Pseudomonadales bacterium]|jgi:shikimate dehydrogenase
MDRYAVIGNPVTHSLSPRIHQAFAAQTGASIRYERIEAPLDGFVRTVDEFFAGGGAGCNVTVPFKGEAAAWVGRLHPDAAFADAVNTIVPDAGGAFVGHNTDGGGLVADLTRLLGGERAASVLLLGAGGAARGVAKPLLDSVAAELTIANRTDSKAHALAKRLSATGGAVRACAFAELAGPYDLIINATSAGLTDAVPEVGTDVACGAFCYDMVYGRDTAFCRWARAAGARRTEDGLGMLVGQAALAFELWRGIRPDTEPVRLALRDALERGTLP